ncbi:9044_t:CDS:2 [Ambispora gerdemannii]|uniref:9044_t:CDS:1 n=1 Tax=Ambispora gerdemannii TaxID=144530 RepID=A0A9N8ZDE0_9GLOM|nr:9044_t:CDS:2 [Ambispora gerdemannii]
MTIVCRIYYESDTKTNATSNFTSLLSSSSKNNVISYNGEPPDLNCNIPQVHAITSQLMLVVNLCVALPGKFTSIFVLGALGSLSDRKGRRISLLLATAGICFNYIVTIIIAEHDISPIFFAVGALVEGFTGGLMSLMTISQAYITDCTTPDRRGVMFGWLQGAILLGMSIGPLIGGWIISITNNILSVFYIATIIFLVFFLFILIILPESLSLEKLNSNAQLQLSKKKPQNLWEQIYIVFEPLSILLPKSFTSTRNNKNDDKNEHRNEKMIFLLANVNAMIAAASFGFQAVFVLYTKYKFDWGTLEIGYYIFWLGESRALLLFFGLPLLVKCFIKDRGTNANDVRSQRMLLDIWIIRIGLIIEFLTFVALGKATIGRDFTIAGVIESFSVIAIPTLRSLLTNAVPAYQVGQLLGALSVIDSIMRIVFPIIMNILYSLVVASAPHVIWSVLSGIFAVAAVLSFFVVVENK